MNLLDFRQVVFGIACVVCDRCGGSGLIVVTSDGDELPYRSDAADLVATDPSECIPCFDCPAYFAAECAAGRGVA